MSRWVRFLTAEGTAALGRLEAHGIAEYRGDLFDGPVASGRMVDESAVQLLAPCTPSKVIGLWNNFRAMGAKLGKAAPQHPLFFLKPGSSVIGTGAPIRRPARYGGKIVFEGELGLVVGARCANVSPADAERYIFGYTCVNDVTAAELIGEDANFEQWCRAKGCDTFSCLGPAIATTLDWASARLISTVDGVERQNYPLSDMIFAPPEALSRISGDMTLFPGDVIACGTSLGAGSIREGATVCIRIEAIGELCNRLVG
ncbi:MAG TPA: fumarylacetoacetate hydrolase family protein [Burkholderiaceae bacterium]|nr:fumarylacetoacetate hydrolase family protein [Burkholderiaceae bacterium]